MLTIISNQLSCNGAMISCAVIAFCAIRFNHTVDQLESSKPMHLNFQKQIQNKIHHDSS